MSFPALDASCKARGSTRPRRPRILSFTRLTLHYAFCAKLCPQPQRPLSFLLERLVADRDCMQIFKEVNKVRVCDLSNCGSIYVMVKSAAKHWPLFRSVVPEAYEYTYKDT